MAPVTTRELLAQLGLTISQHEGGTDGEHSPPERDNRYGD